MDSVGLGLVAVGRGQQHHRRQRADGQGRQPQRQFPQPPGQLHRPGGQAAAQHQPYAAQNQRAHQPGKDVLLQTGPAHPFAQIAVAQRTQRHEQAEHHQADRQPPDPIPPGAGEERRQKHRQRVKQVGVAHPDHHAAAPGKAEDQRRSPQLSRPQLQKGDAQLFHQQPVAQDQQHPQRVKHRPDSLVHAHSSSAARVSASSACSRQERLTGSGWPPTITCAPSMRSTAAARTRYRWCTRTNSLPNSAATSSSLP